MQTVNTMVKARESAEPLRLLKRIGSTVAQNVRHWRTALVSVHFSERSKETLEDKILRLIQRDPLACCLRVSLAKPLGWPGGQVGVKNA